MFQFTSIRMTCIINKSCRLYDGIFIRVPFQNIYFGSLYVLNYFDPLLYCNFTLYIEVRKNPRNDSCERSVVLKVSIFVVC